MNQRNIRDITKLKRTVAECTCGGIMNIYAYGSQYYGKCLLCGSKSQTYHSASAVKNEQHKIVMRHQKEITRDIRQIHTNGLAESICCAMCTNPMKSETGCDGGCHVDQDMYKRVMKAIEQQMVKDDIHNAL